MGTKMPISHTNNVLMDKKNKEESLENKQKLLSEAVHLMTFLL